MRLPWFLGSSLGFHSGIGMLGNFLPLIIWSVVWTGLSLWHAARRSEKGWFIFFLFIHTAGIIEILYLIFVAKIFATSKSSSKKRKRS